MYYRYKRSTLRCTNIELSPQVYTFQTEILIVQVQLKWCFELKTLHTMPLSAPSTSRFGTLLSVSFRHDDMTFQRPSKDGQERQATFTVTASIPPNSYRTTMRRVRPSARPRLDFCPFPRSCGKDNSSIIYQKWD